MIFLTNLIVILSESEFSEFFYFLILKILLQTFDKTQSKIHIGMLHKGVTQRCTTQLCPCPDKNLRTVLLNH